MKNAHEYLEQLKRRNKRLFLSSNVKIAIEVSELERVIAEAFNEGKEAGVEEWRNSKSLFETIFG